ncbi:MAG: alanine--tRNA ligase-related protein, partial [Mangrovicoccus sp.]|nr:alanine--tRNA ligase-related protein [Mangrovicoccus sp.]
TADATVFFDLAEEHGSTEFLGYDTEVAEGQILALIADGKDHPGANAGDKVQIVTNQTPFYAESGGQVGDSGTIRTDTGLARITDTKKSAGIFVHFAEVTEGALASGQGAEMVVEHSRRSAIRANHSATHLLHEALRHALGDHVAQRGSLNAEDRLRFDFSHSKALTPQELASVEADVNAYIRQNAAVETRIMTPDEARELGAQALFGEKYGDEVRVVSMGAQSDSGKGVSGDVYSLELCGGTHVRQTGDIGVFVTLGDSASSAGVRRIEALTGAAAFDYLAAQDRHLSDAALALKAQPAEVPERIRSLLDERKALQSELADLRRELAMAGGSAGAGPEAKDIGGVSFLGQTLSGVTGKDLPALIDAHKEKLGSGAVLLIADAGGKAAIAAGVTADLTDKISAVDMVRAAAGALGGKGGGGRPDMAQAGGPSAENAAGAISAVEALLEG